MSCNVVCISHETGAGGEEVGRIVADRLGFLYLDEEIIARAAARGELDPGDVADEERRKSLIARALEAMVAHGGGEAWAMAGAPPMRTDGELSSDSVRVLIRETIEQAAARGGAVIVAHAASHAVAKGPESLRVLVTASPQTRAARVAGERGVDEKSAAREIKNSDAGRRDYLRRFYELDEELPTHYDLVVNTDVLTLEQVAGLVVHAGTT